MARDPMITCAMDGVGREQVGRKLEVEPRACAALEVTHRHRDRRDMLDASAVQARPSMLSASAIGKNNPAEATPNIRRPSM